MFDLQQFRYDLPDELIAQTPLPNRDASRLFVKKDGRIIHDHIQSIDKYFSSGDVIVINDSKVFPCRLLGKTEHGGAIEIFLLEQLTSNQPDTSRWRALGKPMKKLRVGATVKFDDELNGIICGHDEEHQEQPTLTIEFNLSQNKFEHWLQSFGYIPLPPYIRRPDPLQAPQSKDTARYQTIYARAKGSVAAPTAGLHFTEALLQKLKNKGVTIANVTLHVGAGTFLPIKTSDIDEHFMHTEKFSVPAQTLKDIFEARKSGNKVAAVGTTSLRSLESLYLQGSKNLEKMGALSDRVLSTQLFIKPTALESKYKPALVDALITNFHQSESTLFILVCALCGIAEAQAMYQEAVKEKYRFFSYGDACLFWL